MRYLKALELGYCKNGHPVNTEADFLAKHTRGYVVRRCRECQRLLSEKYRRRKGIPPANRITGQKRVQLGNGPRYIDLDCGHQLIFEAPLPVPDDIVLCYRCDNYREVVKWGKLTKEDK